MEKLLGLFDQSLDRDALDEIFTFYVDQRGATVALAELSAIFWSACSYFAAIPEERVAAILKMICTQTDLLSYHLLQSEEKLQKRFILSQWRLFSRYFARKCRTPLAEDGTIVDQGLDQLSQLCYMWWDIIDIAPTSEPPNECVVQFYIIRVLERLLASRSEACVVSALHGLSHFIDTAPFEVDRIFARYLARLTPPSSLYSFAIRARGGALL
jgi:hypothetical protein